MTGPVSLPLIRVFVFLLLRNVLVPTALGQVNIQGHWSTQSYSIPSNPIHVALLPATVENIDLEASSSAWQYGPNMSQSRIQNKHSAKTTLVVQ